MPFEKNNTYGKNNKRGLGKNKEAIKEYENAGKEIKA